MPRYQLPVFRPENKPKTTYFDHIPTRIGFFRRIGGTRLLIHGNFGGNGQYPRVFHLNVTDDKN